MPHQISTLLRQTGIGGQSLSTLGLALGLVCGILNAPMAFAEESVAEFSSGPLSFSLSQDQGDYQLLVGTGGQIPNHRGALNAKVFSLKNPARLIIDLPFVVDLTKDEVKVNDQIVKGVRFGTHPGKTRVVLDLNEKNAPRHSVREDPAGDALAIRFWFPSKTSEPEESFVANIDKALEGIQQDSLNKQTPASTTKSATLRRKNVRSQRASAKPQVTKVRPKSRVAATPKRTNKKTTASYSRAKLNSPIRHLGVSSRQVAGGVVIRLRLPGSQQSVPHSTSEKSILSSIAYTHGEDGRLSAIRIEVSNLQNYLLENVGKEEYALRLFGTAESKTADLKALCAPEESVNLQAIIPKARPNGTVLDIYVEQGTRLRAKRTHYGLQLQAY